MTHDFAIAFELLKPVLEKANAKQLENIENYSPVSLNLELENKICFVEILLKSYSILFQAFTQ